jgi:competence protein ComEA
MKKGEATMEKLRIVMAVIVSVLVLSAGGVFAEEAQETVTPQQQEMQASENTEQEKIDLNAATQEVLETLKGVGPKLAEMIIAGRPYEKVEDLLTVKGIGTKKLENIKDFVVVNPIEEEKSEKE